MISLNRKTLAPTQSQDMPFNSMVMFNDRVLAASASGIHAMNECGDASVDAFFETPLSDWNLTNQKRIRRVHIAGEFAGTSMKVKTKNKEGNEREYTATSSQSGEENIYANVGRDGKGRHWALRIENVNGEDFSVDAVSIISVILNRRR